MYFYTYKFKYIMWNILHLSAFLLVVPTIFYQCTDNASGTLRQFSDLQQYLSESEKGGGGSDLSTLLSREGREVSIDLIHAPWPPLTHHYTARDLIQQRKRAYTKYCTVYTYTSDTVFQCRKTQLKGWLKQEYLNAINGP
jgi:hypothetical protein